MAHSPLIFYVREICLYLRILLLCILCDCKFLLQATDMRQLDDLDIRLTMPCASVLQARIEERIEMMIFWCARQGLLSDHCGQILSVVAFFT